MMMSSVGYENWNLLHWFRGVATKDEEPQKKMNIAMSDDPATLI